MRKKRTMFSLCIIVLLLIATVSGVGCPNNSQRYETLIVTRGLGHFSFEYPRRWQVTIVETRENYTDVTIVAPFVKVQKTTLPSSVFIIHIREPNKEIADSASALEYSLAYWKTQDDFKLIDRSPIHLSGIQGERIIFTENQGTDFYRITEPEPRISQEFYFDHGGMIWDIYVSSLSKYSESDKIDIEHILQTFKILD